ncbi:nicotinate phosphoribosyltransferase, partial [Pseudomonas aeruginosa]
YLAGLAISAAQVAFFERIPFLAPDFIRFLGFFCFNPRYVQTGIEIDEFLLRLKGPWLHVILFYVPLLAMISEVRNRARYPAATVEQAR